MTELVDSVRLSDSFNCLRLYYYRHLRHLTTPEKALSLLYGGALHAGLAEKYRGGPLTQQCQAFDREWILAGGREDPKRNARQGFNTLVAYNALYGDDSQWEILGVEMPFIWPISSNLIWVGIIDLLVRTRGGQLLLADHKTTSLMTENWWHHRNPNHQYSGYIGAARAVLGMELSSLLVNAIGVTKNKTINESNFERRLTSRSEKEIEKWIYEIQTWWDIVSLCRDHQSWPRNPHYCNEWNRLCDYHIICTMSGIDYRTWEPSPELFIYNEWDPLKSLREKGMEVSI